MDAFERYLASLAATWESFVAPHPGGRVDTGPGYLAAVCPPHHVFANNAVVLTATALPEVIDLYAGQRDFAVWSRDGAVDTALEQAGFRRDVTTLAMHADLADLPARPVDLGHHGEVLCGVSADLVAEVNGMSSSPLRGAPGLRNLATPGGEAVAVLLDVDDDVSVTLVATRPVARRRGHATGLLLHALHEARGRGRRTATLQSTPAAERLYARLGFQPVLRWQEWTPARTPHAGGC